MSFKFSNTDQDIELHNFDGETGLHLNTTTLKIEANTGLPAHSTIAPLPTLKLNQVCVFKADKWQVLENNLGDIWDTATKEHSVLTELGPIPDGKTKLDPAMFENWNGSKWLLDTAAQLTDAQLATIAKIQGFATQCRKTIAGDADHYQTAAWPEKSRRAERILENTPRPSDIAILDSEALHRGKGETATVLAQIQVDKAARFAQATSVIDGMTSGAVSAINATTDIDQIDALLTTLKTEANQQLTELIT
ncbi:MAG: hypothetical protein OFPI_00120 [Osedax symbiont Rs2]|nr:MAG: hypothetical protein OFPI_00120 [Osedax symbiont Rs2]